MKKLGGGPEPRGQILREGPRDSGRMQLGAVSHSPNVARPAAFRVLQVEAVTCGRALIVVGLGWVNYGKDSLKGAESVEA